MEPSLIWLQNWCVYRHLSGGTVKVHSSTLFSPVYSVCEFMMGLNRNLSQSELVHPDVFQHPVE
ncbi:MAG: hypothetical protein AAGC96_14100, partial [Pseudomonadota bacterium]